MPPCVAMPLLKPFGRREHDVLAVGGPDRFVLGVDHQRIVGDVTLFRRRAIGAM